LFPRGQSDGLYTTASYSDPHCTLAALATDLLAMYYGVPFVSKLNVRGDLAYTVGV